jgi:predicted thioesterase
VEVGYRAPTPLGVRLAVSARLDRVDGRKLFVSGQVAVAGVVTAQANAVFVKLTRASVASIFPTSRVPRA